MEESKIQSKNSNFILIKIEKNSVFSDSQARSPNVAIQIHDRPSAGGVAEHRGRDRLHRHHDVDSGQILALLGEEQQRSLSI